ncbi:hypothetical protein BKH46_00985 [Helicobacter sp. 12S02634-8]|uniref:hypothetical protein n=1 Tax=Helicobacter sp. 12S02634-8 TaxID=1476199 RepID=UPI000BA5FA4E|nr:hypothetical protein [Helicobacter sp. 12S02634-8]PAF48511.1 hypothetical protein BKH46_00985 [Helicobacter sp. 12S02634-8]
MSYISDFIKQYEATQSELAPHFESDLKGLLKEISYKITDERFAPSIELKTCLKNISKKAKEPIKIAIMGGGNNGKATFINTILKSHILPSDPMHSHKTYIISYGHTKSIIAYHKNKEASGLNLLSLNTLTPEELDKISYFEIKSPLAMLKEYTIYKYPDISLDDPEALNESIDKIQTSEVLIWLNRIDDLANAEELNALKAHIAKKSATSLCVLTHIDILAKSEDIIPTLNFAKEHFGEVFSDILPLSAMVLYRELGIDGEFFVQKELQKLYCHYTTIKTKDPASHQKLLLEAFEQANQSIKVFYTHLSTIPTHLQKQAINLEAIFNKLNSTLIPRAKHQREQLIKEELLSLVYKIKKSYTQITNIYAKFLSLLQRQLQQLQDSFDGLRDRTFEELELFFKSLASDHNTIIESIQAHTLPETITIPITSPNFLQTLKGKKDRYTTYKIDTALISSELLHPKSRSYRTHKALLYKISKLATMLDMAFEKSIDDFSAELKKWQAQNELIKKREAILSDFSYNNLRIFASKLYENIMLDFIECILETNQAIQILFSQSAAMLQSTRKLSIQHTLTSLEYRLHQDIKQASAHYTPKAQKPSKEEIQALIDTDFSTQAYAHMLLENEGSLKEIFAYLKTDIDKLQEEKTLLVEKKIKDLESLTQTIDTLITNIEAKEGKSIDGL